MSLMFAALRTLDGERPGVATPAPARGVRLARLRGAAPWLGAGVLLGGLAMWIAAPSPAPVATSEPVVVMAPVAAVLSLPAPAAEPPVMTMPVATASTIAPVASMVTPAPAPAAPTAPPVPAPAPEPAPTPDATPRPFAPLPAGSLIVRDAAAARAPTPRDSDEPDPAAVARQVDAMGDAITQGDYDAAQTHLQTLQHLLPPQSLTLLRMRAWLAQQRGDDAQALPLYREIVERMPGDRGAAINLALLEATAGQLDEARQRLRRLQANEGGASENERQALARAITEIGASP